MESFTFQAETGQLLRLVIHSLYTQREVFLRELIANASDALDRLRFEAISHPDLCDDNQPLEIVLEVDPSNRTLTIRDNGIGMFRQELIDHIGTIARSGTRELLEQLRTAGAAAIPDLIGRFGVGFYSSFMVAERVVLVTRRAEEPQGTRWESRGDVEYTIDDAGAVPRGTAVTLHLRPVDPDGGLEDYTDRWVLTRIVKQYADFVSYPIAYLGPDAGLDGRAGDSVKRIVLNSMRPIWTKPEREVTAAEYTQFYSQVTHDTHAPLIRMSFKAEGRWEYTALVFIPSRAPHDLFFHAGEYGLQLYSQRMLIVKDCRDMLPRYLRFLRGVVDAGDLALHVSRQALQQSRHLDDIRKWLTRKVVDELTRLREREPDQYLTFWREFGRALKEGVSEDHANRERLLPLMLFESSAHPTELTSLAEYVSRMPAQQRDIYYLVGENRAVVERAPQLEAFLARGYEVLFLTAPVDELLVRATVQFDGRLLRSAANGDVDLTLEDERDESSRWFEAKQRELAPLLDAFAVRLQTHVRAVRLSKRLSASPACMSGDPNDMSPLMERVLLHGGSAVPKQRRILEINPRHPVIAALESRQARDGNDPVLGAAADLLLGFAALAESSPLPDPAGFTSALVELLGHAATAAAPPVDIERDAAGASSAPVH